MIDFTVSTQLINSQDQVMLTQGQTKKAHILYGSLCLNKEANKLLRDDQARDSKIGGNIRKISGLS